MVPGLRCHHCLAEGAHVHVRGPAGALNDSVSTQNTVEHKQTDIASLTLHSIAVLEVVHHWKER